mgnify:CR=1 FL=1
MTSINAGGAFYRVQAALDQNATRVADSMQRLATGKQNISPGDNAGTVALSTGLRAELASLQVGQRNATEALNALEMATTDIQTLSDLVIRLEELNSLGENALNSAIDRLAIKAEAKAIIEEFDDGHVAFRIAHEGRARRVQQRILMRLHRVLRALFLRRLFPLTEDLDGLDDHFGVFQQVVADDLFNGAAIGIAHGRLVLGLGRQAVEAEADQRGDGGRGEKSFDRQGRKAKRHVGSFPIGCAHNEPAAVGGQGMGGPGRGVADHISVNASDAGPKPAPRARTCPCFASRRGRSAPRRKRSAYGWSTARARPGRAEKSDRPLPATFCPGIPDRPGPCIGPGGRRWACPGCRA